MTPPIWRRIARWWNQRHTGVPQPCAPGHHVLTAPVDHGTGLRVQRCGRCDALLIAPPEPPPGD